MLHPPQRAAAAAVSWAPQRQDACAGTCFNNMPPFGRNNTKVEQALLFKNYKLCLTMENSISSQYVTEKVR